MVASARSLRTLRLLAPVVVLSLVLIITGLAVGLDEEEDDRADMTEDFNLTLDELGNSRVSFTLSYPEELYEKLGDIVKEYPNFLIRRYATGDTLKEAKNYKAKMNDPKRQVTISYDSPGYAYNWKDYWALQGFRDRPVKSSKRVFIFEKEFVGNSDLTLYKSVKVKRTINVKLPRTARKARYDKEDRAIKYEVPWEGQAGFFGRNRTLLCIIFGVSTMVLLLLLASWLRMTRPLPAAPQPSAAPVRTPVGPSAAAGTQDEAATRLCTSCGERVSLDKKFCTKCGTPLG